MSDQEEKPRERGRRMSDENDEDSNICDICDGLMDKSYMTDLDESWVGPMPFDWYCTNCKIHWLPPQVESAIMSHEYIKLGKKNEDLREKLRVAVQTLMDVKDHNTESIILTALKKIGEVE